MKYSPRLCAVVSVWGFALILLLVIFSPYFQRSKADIGSSISPSNDVSVEPPHYDITEANPILKGDDNNKNGKSLETTASPTRDIFSENDEDEEIVTFQTECLLSSELCEAFSDQCCPGTICVPVNEFESRCSNSKGTICLSTGALCNDRVIGVECCDGGTCTPTPEEGEDKSRCFLSSVSASTTEFTSKTLAKDTSTETPSDESKLSPESLVNSSDVSPSSLLTVFPAENRTDPTMSPTADATESRRHLRRIR